MGAESGCGNVGPAAEDCGQASASNTRSRPGEGRQGHPFGTRHGCPSGTSLVDVQPAWPGGRGLAAAHATAGGRPDPRPCLCRHPWPRERVPYPVRRPQVSRLQAGYPDAHPSTRRGTSWPKAGTPTRARALRLRIPPLRRRCRPSSTRRTHSSRLFDARIPCSCATRDRHRASRSCLVRADQAATLTVFERHSAGLRRGAC